MSELTGNLEQVYVELDFDSEAFPLMAESNLIHMEVPESCVQT